mmetsp:Transcript_68400/g.216385  ORF Transcript_68400/g.216385 Transcript_68400/m.216385 type:complete len:548 (-) Transcript_68400:77-1720(-)
MKEETMSALAKARQIFKDMEMAALTPVILMGAGLLTFLVCFALQPRMRSESTGAEAAEAEAAVCAGLGGTGDDGEMETKTAAAPRELEAVPLAVIMGLTSYRFHTGFLGATWVPFIIAKEAESLVPAAQTVFMGEAKLVYGFSLCFNPLFGLLSDRLAGVSRMCGRATFLIIGVCFAGAGIYIAKVASDAADASGYLVASAVWMLGEAMADTTTEAVVPELLPPKQYDLASGVRSGQAFAGSLTGLVCIIIFRDVHHHWLYLAYVVMMVVCTFITVLLMQGHTSGRAGTQSAEGFSLGSVLEAYIVPLQRSGNFARACIATFFFSLGTAPIFFTLLVVRDLVGITSQVEQQIHFSCASITFLLCAVVSSLALVTGTSSDGEAADAAEPPGDRSHAAREQEERRWNLMALFTAAYGTSVLGYPLVGIFASVQADLVVLYLLSCVLGLSYGAVYSLVQTCTWSIIPRGANVANWMGLASLAKVTGCGLGNFVAGLILDSFRARGGRSGVAVPGYAAMSWYCAVSVFLSVAIVRNLHRRVLAAPPQQQQL